MKLFNYWRSSTAYRVRIALELKGVPYEVQSVSLVKEGGENLKPEYLAINPQGRVPALALDDQRILLQSPAILEYLEERYPAPPLLPTNLEERAHVRALCAIVACDIHPLNNVRTLRVLRAQGQDEVAVQSWIARWIEEGFHTIEGLVGDSGFCHGDTPSLADVCLVPQVYNARRFGVSMDVFPRIRCIEQQCAALPAFDRAKPEAQPDATA
ncbi:maleylacetoacetate isomerase [Variovorax terrae]|uniref:Maleylacetoacetate isomerase n=1 Tax=Variovorax terrae TaxID=2923278 RepID=A0A9X2APU3_9BURK|nr:maleylacetoacetate isomerase [Variovorax terrae]MCJ0766173.1 maleylacetoacetate isomerase [Variovorax terrae]